jgi:3-oxoacid CoA-transferase
MATAAKCVIAEVEHIVEEGDLLPEEIHLSGVYVDKVIKATLLEKKIEKPVFTEEKDPNYKGTLFIEIETFRDVIARRASKEIKDGMYINLGVGIPTLVP